MASRNRFLNGYGFLFLIAGLIIASDQWTKAIVRANLSEYEMWAPWDWLMPYARITHVYNTGVAFGMFQGMWQIFAVLAVIVSLAIIYYFPRVPVQDWTLRLAMGMQLGGALGNLIDRLTQQGRVTDFISVGSFPVWNIADASITVGVAVMVLGIWLQERQQRVSQSRPSQDSGIEGESSPQDSNAG